MDFFKTFRLQLILLCFTSFSFSQIESGKVRAPEQKEKKSVEKDKEVKLERVANYNPENVLYVGGSLGNSFRSLKPNKGYFGDPLGERADEIPQFTGGFTVGMRTRIVNHLYLDFGVSLAKYGEDYEFGTIDSVYQYTSKYTHFAIPLKLQFVTGKKVRFVAGIGLQPQMFINYKQEINWTTTENVKGERTVENGDLNFFTIAALANVGVEWQFAKNASVYVLPEVRSQLNSTYGKQASYIHKGMFYGVQLGFSFGLN